MNINEITLAQNIFDRADTPFEEWRIREIPIKDENAERIVLYNKRLQQELIIDVSYKTEISLVIQNQRRKIHIHELKDELLAIENQLRKAQ